MPGGDRTGPMGFGPMSGRGMGWCGRSGGLGAYGPGRANSFGWGGGRGGRGGRGWRNRFYATGVPGWGRALGGGPWAQQPAHPGWTGAGDEVNNLQQYAASLEQELADIKARITEMERERKASASPDA